MGDAEFNHDFCKFSRTRLGEAAQLQIAAIGQAQHAIAQPSRRIRQGARGLHA